MEKYYTPSTKVIKLAAYWSYLAVGSEIKGTDDLGGEGEGFTWE